MEKYFNVKRAKTRSRAGYFIRSNYVGWLFNLPLIIGLLVFTAIPMVLSLYYSFYDVSVGYVVFFLYILLTACLFSLSENIYWLTLIFGLITLYDSLFLSTLIDKIEEEKFNTKLLIALCVSIVNLPSFILNIIAYFYKKESKYVLTQNPKFHEGSAGKTPKKWYKKGSFRLVIIGFVGMFLCSFFAQIGETSGYQVEVSDFTLTKAMTDEFNKDSSLSLNGENYYIESDVLSYGVTEYKPKSASKTNPLPVIFVMPGFTRTKTTMAQYAIELSKRNAVVFVLDPGCQGATTYSGYDENGEMISSTVGANGLNYLVQYVYNNTEKYTYIDRNNFGAVGHSAGGGNVAQTAEAFAGSTYDDSIIKSVYISGYIKVSAANRFKNFRCNAALSYAYYDEGAFRYQGSTSALEIIHNRFINEVNGKTLDNGNAIIDYEYGNMEDGTYRVIHKEAINHCFEMYDPLSISNTINFFRRTLDLDTTLSDSSQSWFVKEGFNGLALCSSFIFIFSLVPFLIDVVPLFNSFKEERKKRKEYEDLQKVKYGYASDIILENREIAKDVKVTKKTFVDKVIFWSIFVLTAIIACLDYIPLARVTMDFFPDAASNTFTFYFPARMMNAVMLWAVVNGLIGLVLVFASKAIENLVYKLIKQEEKINWYRFKALKINWKDLLKSFGFAVFLFLLFYLMVELSYLIFHQDFRFMLISAAPLQPRFIVTWLIYLVPFFVFYLSNSIRVNLSIANEGWSETKVMPVSALGNSIGLVFILVINYFVYFNTGTVFYGYYSATDTSEMWLYINMVFALIPMMILLPILNRFCFKKTGNVYFGAMVTCMIFIMMSLSASVSYIPM